MRGRSFALVSSASIDRFWLSSTGDARPDPSGAEGLIRRHLQGRARRAQALQK